jgi:hypothetical protein
MKKNFFVIMAAFLAAAACAPVALAQGTEAPVHWYGVKVEGLESSEMFYGSMTLDESQLQQELQKGGFIQLQNLVYLQNEIAQDGTEVFVARPFQEHLPIARSSVFISVSKIIVIFPLNGDPRMPDTGKVTAVSDQKAKDQAGSGAVQDGAQRKKQPE